MGAAGSNVRFDGRFGVFATGLLLVQTKVRPACYSALLD